MKKSEPRSILKFRADPVLRRAIKLRAALDDSDLQDVVVDVLTKGLSAEIKEVLERGLVDRAAQEKKAPRKRKGQADE